MIIYEFQKGNPQSGSSYKLSNSSTQYTNWDASLDQAGQPQPLRIELRLT